MPNIKPSMEPQEIATSGFGTVDEKGRVLLSMAVRKAWGVRTGSSLAYVLLDHALMLIPQDEHLAALLEQATRALTSHNITVQDLLDDLPAARAEVVGEAYRAEFLQDLERLRAAQPADQAASTPAE